MDKQEDVILAGQGNSFATGAVRQAISESTFVDPQPLHFYSHRSGHETGQYCPRRRYLAYHHLGTGVNLFPPIYFDIGTAVHAGLAFLMLAGNHILEFWDSDTRHEAGANAIAVALDYFRQTPVYQTLDPFSVSEQETLIAGLLWAFYYRAWSAFMAKFEVLFVEESSEDEVSFQIDDNEAVLHILSRPDVIVRDRETGEVVAINWKTINSITDERRDNITNSLQVNLEAYYAERLYSRYMNESWVPEIPKGLAGDKLAAWLEQELATYREREHHVAYTQIVYLVKGPRVLALADGTELSPDVDTDQEKFWRQDSALCYRYVNLGDTGPSGRSKKKAEEFPDVAWSTRYYKTGNVSYNLLGSGYAKQPVWEGSSLNDGMCAGLTPIKLHIAAMNSGQMFPSTMPDERNARNPLDKIVVFEQPIYRDRDRQDRLREQFIADEKWTSQSLNSLAGISEFEPLSSHELEGYLDLYFPQHLISCRKPTRCEFDRICNAPVETRGLVGDLVQITPGGVWQARQPHHKGEREAFGLKGDTLAE